MRDGDGTCVVVADLTLPVVERRVIGLVWMLDMQREQVPGMKP